MVSTSPARPAILLVLTIIAGCGGGGASALPTGAPPTPADPTPSSAAQTAPPSPSASSSGAVLPAFQADEPLILFTRLTGAGGGVFVLRPDGTGQARLGADVLPGVHKRGDWSPDGQRVVFIDETKERMWIASLDGSPTVAVPTCDVPGCDFPSWSPDGTRIVFSRYENADGVVGPQAVGIHVVDLATNEVTPVVRLERPLLADVPRWSPDGSHIVFGIDQMDDEAFDTGAAIAVVPTDGGEHRILTDFAEFAYIADWSWTTDEIVYSVSAFDLQREGAPRPSTWDLYGIRADGSGVRQITHLKPGHRLVGPRWTPDGRSITAFDVGVGRPVLIDPTSGEVQDFGVAGVETRPILRPTP